MNLHRQFRRATFILIGGLTLGLFYTHVYACTFNWGMPANHFDGVDEQGYVSYWENVDYLDCGDGILFPININFSSKRIDAGASKYLGQGWAFPLLESRFLQTGENRFTMIQPDGGSRSFKRDASDESVLTGDSGWKGVIANGGIKVWAPCGWKIEFVDGRIRSMTTPKGRSIEWVYRNKRVVEIGDRTNVCCRVSYDETNDSVAALTLLNGNRVGLADDRIGQFQKINGSNALTGFVRALKTLSTPSGATHTYKLDLDDPDRSTLTISYENPAMPIRTFAWNPATKLIQRDNGWLYDRVSCSEDGSVSFISRSNSLNQRESYGYDHPAGRVTEVGIDGVQRTSTYFNGSGPLYHRLRLVETEYKGKKERTTAYSYDESGRLIALKQMGKRFIVSYNKSGGIDTISCNDSVLLTNTGAQKDYTKPQTSKDP